MGEKSPKGTNSLDTDGGKVIYFAFVMVVLMGTVPINSIQDNV